MLTVVVFYSVSYFSSGEIGQGTYSSVYRARDLETGKIVALKKVRFVNMDPESVRFMAREIHILRKLDHPNVIKLEGIVTSRMSSNLYLVFEYMEHDLAGLAATPGIKFTEPQVKCFMRQLLSGLDHCHSCGVLHRDIKGANLLIDSNGNLKIGDFGLASVFNPEKKQPLTSRVVTLWYRPPELLLGATEYDVAIDLWSAGCILAELLFGKPIMPGRTEVEQLHKIFKLCGSPAEDYWKRAKLSQSTIFRPQHPYPRRIAETFRDFPSSALNLLDTLLAIEPDERGTAASALQSEFFTTTPFACDPSSLPKYPPSKEYGARLRDEESRRQREAATKGGVEDGRRETRDSQTKPLQYNGNGVQKRQANNKCTSQKYSPLEDTAAGFPIEPPSGDGYRCAGSTMHPGAYGNLRNKNIKDDRQTIPGRSVSNLKVVNGVELRTQRSYRSQYGDAGDLSNFASRNKATLRCIDRPASTHRKDDGGGKDSAMGYGNKNKRLHYSGPLVPPGGNMDDMLKEHERQIQQAEVNQAEIDRQKKIDDWLPVTASRKAKWWYSAFHNVTAMVGAGVLGLPFALSQLGWAGGLSSLIASWLITFYSLWQLVEMHEEVPGKRFDRYHELGQHAFGPKLGLWIVVPQQLFVQASTNIVYGVTGGKSLKKFFDLLIPSVKSVKLTYYIFIFGAIQLILSQTPNFNSLRGVSLLAAFMSFCYSAIALIASVIRGKDPGISYGVRSSNIQQE
ncbi:uncharacterized protein A4U43_C09F3800 [Asparagus officinalis]|uniref:[RNA-polymerase]-subunit kinase n=1 Tax=Asparagus officinalis TaxID=4686 RepID=A0A5P1E5M2_ASPOF|nr:uncharacterized protein A4U43_C09F3800 [Asparagus officinalis]